MVRTKSNGSKDSAANLGFEAQLWLAAERACWMGADFGFCSINRGNDFDLDQ